MLKYKFVALVVVTALLAVFALQMARGCGTPKIQEAIRHARATLPDFRKRLENPSPDDRAFFLRVRFKDPDGFAEFLWVKKVGIAPNGFTGTVDEAPKRIKRVQKGSEASFPESDIVDWTILHSDKTIEGGFTQSLEP